MANTPQSQSPNEEEKYKFLNDVEYQTLRETYSAKELKRRLEASKLNKSQIETLFAGDANGLLSLLTSSISDELTNSPKTAEALQVATNQKISPAQFKKYIAQFPASIQNHLNQLRAIVLNSPEQTDPYRPRTTTPKIKTLIGSLDSPAAYTPELETETQQLIVDYIKRTATNLDPQSVSNAEKAIEPINVSDDIAHERIAPNTPMLVPNYASSGQDELYNDEYSYSFSSHSSDSNHEFAADLEADMLYTLLRISELTNQLANEAKVGFFTLAYVSMSIAVVEANQRVQALMEVTSVNISVETNQRVQAQMAITQLSFSSSANHPNSFFRPDPSFIAERLSTCSQEARPTAPVPLQNDHSIAEDFTRLMTALVR